MSIQDDIFDINDHLDGGNLQDAWNRVLQYLNDYERLSDSRGQQIHDLETTIKVLKTREEREV